MATLRIEGMEALLKKIDNLQKLNMVAGALLAGGAHLKSAMQVYPPQVRLTRKSVYGRSFQSDRQRKWFFAALREGKLQIPYRRTRNLANRWTVTDSNNGLTVEVGNNTAYGPMMQAQAAQGRYAKASGWQTEQQIIDREGPAVVTYVKDAIEKAVNE